MPLNSAIESKFIMDEEYHYKIKVIVEGGNIETRWVLLKSLCFEVDEKDWFFFAYPTENGVTTMSRTIFARQASPAPPAAPL